MGPEHPVLLVTGANGNLGRQVVQTLVAAGHDRVVAVSRHPDKIADLRVAGAETRRGDFDDPGSLRGAFEGADHLLIVSTDQLSEPGRREKQHRAALEAASEAGVRFIAYTSMPHPERASAIPFASDHVAMERDLSASGVAHAVLRNSWYTEDLLLWLPSVLSSGRWYTAASDGRIPFVSRDDTARTAAAVLRSGQTGVIDVTGPEVLTVHAMADIVRDVFSRPVEVVPVSDAELPQALRDAGMPDAFIPTAAMTDANQRGGHFDLVTTAVRDLTGREPERLRDFLVARKAAILAGLSRT